MFNLVEMFKKSQKSEITKPLLRGYAGLLRFSEQNAFYSVHVLDNRLSDIQYIVRNCKSRLQLRTLKKI